MFIERGAVNDEDARRRVPAPTGAEYAAKMRSDLSPTRAYTNFNIRHDTGHVSGRPRARAY